MIEGNFLSEMVRSVRKDGIGALYWGFFAFCMESFPYDIMELVRASYTMFLNGILPLCHAGRVKGALAPCCVDEFGCFLLCPWPCTIIRRSPPNPALLGLSITPSMLTPCLANRPGYLWLVARCP